jgi:protein TonB
VCSSDLGADGKVTSCTVTSSSGSDDLDSETCRLLPRRARFKPAVGSGGQPMADTYSGRITWKMPD